MSYDDFLSQTADIHLISMSPFQIILPKSGPLSNISDISQPTPATLLPAPTSSTFAATTQPLISNVVAMANHKLRPSTSSTANLVNQTPASFGSTYNWLSTPAIETTNPFQSSLANLYGVGLSSSSTSSAEISAKLNQLPSIVHSVPPNYEPGRRGRKVQFPQVCDVGNLCIFQTFIVDGDLDWK